MLITKASTIAPPPHNPPSLEWSHARPTVAIHSPIKSAEDLAQLLASYRPELVRKAQLFASGDTDITAEDIVQQGIERALKHLKGKAYLIPRERLQTTEENETGRHDIIIEKPEGWLWVIVHNTGVNYCKSKAHREAPEKAWKQLEEDWIYEDPETTLIRKETRKEEDEKLHDLLDKLSPRYKKAIKLRFFKEYSYQQIADETGQPLNTVKSDVKRAKEMLRDAYKKERDIKDGRIARRRRQPSSLQSGNDEKLSSKPKQSNKH